METIMIAVLKFIGQSSISGLTWDIMKKAGSKFVVSFKKHFMDKKYFDNDKQVEEFLQSIFSKESYNRKFPLEDMWAIYDNCTHQMASDDFKNEMINWLKSNSQLLQMNNIPVQPSSIMIEKQINKDSAKVTNIGTQYNYGSEK